MIELRTLEEYKERNPERDEEQVEAAFKMINNILKYIVAGGYAQGMRNTIAVDLSICCYVLGEDNEIMAEQLVETGMLDEHADDEYVSDRFEKVTPYLRDWDNSTYGTILDYMIDRPRWER